MVKIFTGSYNVPTYGWDIDVLELIVSDICDGCL